MSETVATDTLKNDVVELVKKIDHVITTSDKEQLEDVSRKAEQFKALFLKGMKTDWKPATLEFYAEKFGVVESAYTTAHAAAFKEAAKVDLDYNKLLADITKTKKVAFAAGLKELSDEADQINTDLRAAIPKKRTAETVKKYRDELDKLDKKIETEKKAAATQSATEEVDDGKSWKFKDAKAEYSAEINEKANKVALKAYEDFAKKAKVDKKHPVEVAGDQGLECKLLKGSKTQYEIKLSGKQRATFTIDLKTRTTTVHQVGGHT